MTRPFPTPPRHARNRRRHALASGAAFSILMGASPLAAAQQAGSQPTAAPGDGGAPLATVLVTADRHDGAYAAAADYAATTADLGPLGVRSIQDTPQSISVVPEDLMVNQQARTVNDTLRYLPSVEVRDQQGLEVSRPQSRGFQGSIVQNTRLDGLNIIGTTAIPAENLSGIQVLNGMAGSLYGPESPAGVFNYMLKRPTDETMFRFIESYDSNGIFTEQADAGGRVGSDGRFGYRINALHGQGESYVPGSDTNRTLASGVFDYRIDDRTTVEAYVSYYETKATGLPGSIVYDGAASGSGKSTVIPAAIDPTRMGYGQPGAGTDLTTYTGMLKIKHSFNDDWTLELGGLYQDALRLMDGITNTLTDNAGHYTVTRNFNAIPHFTIGSNSAYLNGRFELAGLANELTIGTNGFINDQFTFRNSLTTNLGSGSLSAPTLLPSKAVPSTGGQYHSGRLSEQSIITGDTVHFTDQLAVQAVVNTSFLSSESYSKSGAVTSSDTRAAVLSPTVSVIYKPLPQLTTYATYSNSVEQGEQAPSGTRNVNQVLSPYEDHQYEVGAKYAVSDRLLLAVAAFRMTRPMAETNATTNVFGVVGLQRNYGVELSAQGAVTHDLSVFGGVTYIDARLENTGNAATNDKMVVGVPHVKTDMVFDYHPDFAGGVALTTAVHAESGRAATNTNNSFADAYATWDVGARYATVLLDQPATLRFQVINVTGTRYFSSIADGTIVGSPGANTAYSGAPRTFQVSAEMDF